MVWQSLIRTKPSLLTQCTFHSGTLPLGNSANGLPLTFFKQYVNELTKGTSAEKSNINITNISINLCLKCRLHQILKKKWIHCGGHCIPIQPQVKLVLHRTYTPWRRKWPALQYSCLENPMDRGAWQAAVYGVARVGDDLATKSTNEPGPILKYDYKRSLYVEGKEKKAMSQNVQCSLYSRYSKKL